ncbi:MAG: hypothetical protein DI540_13650 [Sphingobium sp.]|nr:MAG: hypothetical protein DI540_13650 [Sphingobium sp.]
MTLAALLLAGSAVAKADDASSGSVPTTVRSLAGCWRGEGTVLRKPVTVTLTIRTILLDSMIAVDVDSSAKADAADRYQAHLLFGGDELAADKGRNAISSFWADSFGGGFTATGKGRAHGNGFDVEYRYPDRRYVNQWSREGDHLTWRIISVSGEKISKLFADYALTRVVCDGTR